MSAALCIYIDMWFQHPCTNHYQGLDYSRQCPRWQRKSNPDYLYSKLVYTACCNIYPVGISAYIRQYMPTYIYVGIACEILTNDCRVHVYIKLWSENGCCLSQSIRAKTCSYINITHPQMLRAIYISH